MGSQEPLVKSVWLTKLLLICRLKICVYMKTNGSGTHVPEPLDIRTFPMSAYNYPTRSYQSRSVYHLTNQDEPLMVQVR
jgi:hypothetical protein